jgi:hypothetical protein
MMGMDLRGSGGDFHFNLYAWNQLMTLAYHVGKWEPAGTKPPEWDEDNSPVQLDTDASPKEMQAALAGARDAWDRMNYFTNDYQRVTASDAANLADALERVLSDVPDHDAMTGKWDDLWHGRIKVSPVEFFSGLAGKEKVRKFIAYCRAGSFVIG